MVERADPGQSSEAGRLCGEDREVPGRQGRRDPLGRVHRRARLDRAPRLARRGVATDAPRRGRRADVRGGGDRRRGVRDRRGQRECRAPERHGHRGSAGAGREPDPHALPAHQQPDRARRDGVGPVHRRVRDRDHPVGRPAARAGMDRRADRARLPRDGRRDRVDARRLLLPRLRRLPGVLALDLGRQRADVPRSVTRASAPVSAA